MSSLEYWGSWYQSIAKTCLLSCDSIANHPLTYSRSCEHAYAKCTHHLRQQWTSTQPTTSFSAHGMRSSSLPSLHQARNASSCISCAYIYTCIYIYSYQAGTWRCSLQQYTVCKSQVRSSVVGSELTMASSPWNGCGKGRTRLKGLTTFKRRIICASNSLWGNEQAHYLISTVSVCPTHVLFLPETQYTCFIGMLWFSSNSKTYTDIIFLRWIFLY